MCFTLFGVYLLDMKMSFKEMKVLENHVNIAMFNFSKKIPWLDGIEGKCIKTRKICET